MGNWISGMSDVSRRMPNASVGGVGDKYMGIPAGKISEEIEKEKLASACKAFESFFLQSMLKEMRNTIPKSGLLGGSSAEQVYTSMMDSQLSQQLADSGGIGLADMFRESMSGRVDFPEGSKKN